MHSQIWTNFLANPTKKTLKSPTFSLTNRRQHAAAGQPLPAHVTHAHRFATGLARYDGRMLRAARAKDGTTVPAVVFPPGDAELLLATLAVRNALVWRPRATVGSGIALGVPAAGSGLIVLLLRALFEVGNLKFAHAQLNSELLQGPLVFLPLLPELVQVGFRAGHLLEVETKILQYGIQLRFFFFFLIKP